MSHALLNEERNLNIWAWILSMVSVAMATVAIALVGLYLGAAVGVLGANWFFHPEALPPLPTFAGAVSPEEELARAGVDVQRRVAEERNLIFNLAFCFSLVVGAYGGLVIGGLVGIVAATLACRRWVVPRMKQSALFSYNPKSIKP